MSEVLAWSIAAGAGWAALAMLAGLAARWRREIDRLRGRLRCEQVMSEQAMSALYLDRWAEERKNVLAASASLETQWRTFGAQLRGARIAYGADMAETGAMVGVKSSRISTIETGAGRPSKELYKALCELFELPVKPALYQSARRQQTRHRQGGSA